MEDQSYEEWLEDFATGTFSETELEELGSGVKHATEIDVKNLVREITFLRGLARKVHARLRELGDNDNPLTRYAGLVLDGVRPDVE